MPNADTGIADAGARPRSPTDRAARRIRGLRRNSLGISVMLLAQYGLGMGINLYTPVPKSDQGRGLAVAVGRALSNPPAVLAIHAALGLLLLVAALTAVALLCYLLNLFTLGASLNARQERERSTTPSS